jgi:hypothetical protein
LKNKNRRSWLGQSQDAAQRKKEGRAGQTRESKKKDGQRSKPVEGGGERAEEKKGKRKGSLFFFCSIPGGISREDGLTAGDGGGGAKRDAALNMLHLWPIQPNPAARSNHTCGNILTYTAASISK